MKTNKPTQSDTDQLDAARQIETILCERATSHNPLDERFSFDSSMSDAEIRAKFDAMVALARESRKNANG